MQTAIRTCLALLVGLAVPLSGAPALAAQPAGATGGVTTTAQRSGWIVRIDATEHVIDLGSADGLRPGATLWLYRTVRVKHPLTGKSMLDRFPIGTTTVEDIGSHLSILRPPATLAKLLQVGDLVTMQAPAPLDAPAEPPAAEPGERPGPAPRQPCPVCPVCPPQVDGGPAEPPAALPADEAAADEIFRANLGAQPADRVARWQKFLRRFPNSRLAPGVTDEIRTLNELAFAAQIYNARPGADSAASAEALARARRVYHDILPSLRRGETGWLVFSAADWSRVKDLQVLYRKKGDTHFAMARPEAAGPLHRRWRVPTELIEPPGLEYFAVLVSESGREVMLAGTSTAPTKVEVVEPPGWRPAQPAQSSLAIGAEYVDFNRWRGDDAVVEAHADLTYRLADPGALAAVTMGYGTFAGSGGRVAESTGELHTTGKLSGQPAKKDDTLDSREIAFKFAYLGAEWQLQPSFSLLTRVVVGLDEAGLDSGVEVGTRIGTAAGTNLLLSLSTLGDLGRAGLIALHGRLSPKWRTSALLEVTNRPVREDLAVRLVEETGYRWNERFELTARLGYNLRTLVHAGYSLGAGVTVYW